MNTKLTTLIAAAICVLLCHCTSPQLTEAQQAQAEALREAMKGGRPFQFQGQDGVALHGLHHAAVGKRKHILIMLHGFQTHAAWMTPLARQLADSGFELWCPDRRASATNAKPPLKQGDIPHWQPWVDDLAALVRHVRVEADGVPISLLGYSWGGVIVSAYMDQCPEAEVREAILIAPGLATKTPGKILKAGLMLASRVVPGIKLPIPPPRGLSAPATRSVLMADPQRLSKVTLRYLRLMEDMQRTTLERAAQKKPPHPTLLAQCDVLIDNCKLKSLLDAETLPNATHLLIAEQPEEIARKVKAWLQR